MHIVRTQATKRKCSITWKLEALQSHHIMQHECLKDTHFCNILLLQIHGQCPHAQDHLTILIVNTEKYMALIAVQLPSHQSHNLSQRCHIHLPVVALHFLLP